MIHQSEFTVRTGGRGMHEVTAEVGRAVSDSGVRIGLATVFVHHTSASLTFCENADPDVRRDLETVFARLAPDGDAELRHRTEGPDDMPAHVRSVLTRTSVTLPVADGRCDLGTWQGLYLWEHRARGHARRISVTVVGE